MNEQDVLGAFLLVNNPIVLSEEETKDVQKAIKHLQQENKKLNGAIQTYDILLKANVEENKQLKDNWNKLKEWLNNFHKSSEFEQWEIVKKMQELEQGSDSDENN